MRRILFVFLIPLLASCALQSPEDLITPAADKGILYRGMQLENLGTYQARFTMSYEGSSDWWYQVLLSSDGERTAFNLSIEGIDEALDPGDVRIVKQDGVTTLKGEATEGICWQVPDDASSKVEALSPDDILPPDLITADLISAGGDTILGRRVDHYTLNQSLAPDFSHAEVDIWLEKATGYVLRYNFQLEGEDPIYNMGSGELTGEFEVLDLGSIVVEPLLGCGTDLPLPDDASELYLLPDLVRFQTQLAPDQVVEFMLRTLAQQGWQQAEDTESIPGTTALSFRRGEAVLEVFIQSLEQSTEVRIFQASVPEP